MSSQLHRDSVKGANPAAQPKVRASGSARAACWTALISAPLPVVWRVMMLCGADLGFSQADFFGSNASATAYTLNLKATQALTGILYLGSIYPWGGRVLRQCPLLGSRRVPTFLSLALRGIGSALPYHISVILIIRFGSIWLGLTDDRTSVDDMNGWQVAILVVTYAPMLLLRAPILTIGLIDYWCRHITR